jgi:hypothetical protein
LWTDHASSLDEFSGEPHTITISLQPVSAKEISVVNGEGQEIKIEINAGQFVLPLAGVPRYVAPGVAHLR